MKWQNNHPKLIDELQKLVVKCECGGKRCFAYKQEKLICPSCRNYIYRTEELRQKAKRKKFKKQLRKILEGKYENI